jgi:hypothetical protein
MGQIELLATSIRTISRPGGSAVVPLTPFVRCSCHVDTGCDSSAVAMVAIGGL